MRIAIGSDHAGVDLKSVLKRDFAGKTDWKDFGPFDATSVDYPDYAKKVCDAVLSGEADRGILICGSGIGMSIAANRFKGIRAALCHNAEFAKLSREHNDANVLVLPGRFVSGAEADAIVRTWLETKFSGEERHLNRIRKML
jgi:ribose 5-phosphate isomerase B